MDELDALLPAFDLLPYTDGLAHGCVLARTAQGELIMAFSDPFDPNLRPWAEERAPAAMEWRLAHAADLAAYLARYGETMRAMDALRTETAQEEGDRNRLEELSLKTISEAQSPVVRLVH